MSARLADRPATKSNGGLERVTLNLTPRAARALEIATEITGDSKTDTINRAVQLYAYIERIINEGGTIVAQKTDGSPSQELVFF